MPLTDKVRTRIEEAARAHLLAGEQILAAGMAVRSRRRRQFLLSLLSPLLTAFSQRPYYVVLTDQRLLVLKPGLMRGTSAEHVWADPPSTLHLEESRQGPLNSVLTVRRQTTNEVWRLELNRMYRAEAERIRQALTATG